MDIDIHEVGLTPGYRVVKYPFIREVVSLLSEDGPYDKKVWTPGVRFEDFGEDTGGVADGEGHMMLTVISVHRPSPFPTRVFYTRQFSDPDGNVFGKKCLRVCTLEKFRRISQSYQYPYELP